MAVFDVAALATAGLECSLIPRLRTSKVMQSAISRLFEYALLASRPILKTKLITVSWLSCLTVLNPIKAVALPSAIFSENNTRRFGSENL